jgi:hypothetical protein
LSMDYANLPQFLRCPRNLIGPALVLASLLFAGVTLAQVASDSSASPSALFSQVIANQQNSELLLSQYERVQLVERRRTGSGSDPVDAKFWRLFPTGTGVDKIALSSDGKPQNSDGYRSDLEKLERYLNWIAQDGPMQKEAYAKAEHKLKERKDLIEATHRAFRFTFEGKEMRGDRTLLRYSMEPNPDYHPTTRNEIIFSRVRGTLWIDEQSCQLAKIQGSVIEDISIALFLAKVYKGSQFMQERFEVAPGVWEPTFEQYDFDGRKFMVSFSLHERTFYSDYKRVGPPKEAAAVVRAELNKLQADQPAR